MISKIESLEEYYKIYKESIEQPEIFWASIAETFQWKKKWDKVLEWNFSEPRVEWFQGGQLNITENCLDRHLAERPNQVAIRWEANNPNEKSKDITYKELHTHVCKFANTLKDQGIVKGDRVCLYMPMIPELAIAVLACARIGAIHSVVFAGFSARALIDRINDSDCKLVVTADGAFRGDKTINLKSIVDEALQACVTVKSVIVVKRTKSAIDFKSDRDFWWHDLMANADPHCVAETMNSEDVLFILYTSGSTGKPKGVVHTTAGYMLYAEYTFRNIFQYRDGEMYWCTADIGWVTGHSYIIYGPLLAGATTLMFEGIPTWPDPGRFWQIVEKHKVNIFYTAPTAIRALEACDNKYFEASDLSSLRVLGTVGEPINVEAWEWYHKNIGKSNCPIVDTWWQTETGGIMISPLAGITPTKPSFATLPLPGIQPVLVDGNGAIIEGNGVEGNLCIQFPWPGMLRTTWGDHNRCLLTYFSTYKGMYFTGDGCRRDEDGYYRITGRVDDVINVSGHRLGTAEIENAIDEHPEVIESAVVGYPHAIKGQGIYAFVICTKSAQVASNINQEILATVTKHIGPIAKPDKIQIVTGLPKTRSGKIMRRILRKIAEGDTTNLGDISTLLDPEVVKSIVEGAV